MLRFSKGATCSNRDVLASVVVLSDSAYMNAMGNVYQRTSKIVRLCTHWTKFFRIAPSRRAVRDGETVAFCRLRREGTKGPEYRSGRGATLPLPQAALRTLRPGLAELFTVGAVRAQAAAGSQADWTRGGTFADVM